MNKKHGLSKHQLYSVWRNIKTRCYNPNTHNYSVYGGKGVYLCDEWIDDFEAFYKWSIDNGYQPRLSIDREDSDDGYTPANCRWVTLVIQQRNKSPHRNSKSKFIGVTHRFWDGKNKFLSEISVDNKFIYLGSFDTELDAAKARNNYIEANNLSGYKLNKV